MNIKNELDSIRHKIKQIQKFSLSLQISGSEILASNNLYVTGANGIILSSSANGNLLVISGSGAASNSTGALSYFSENISTSSPNATVNAASLTATGSSAANIDAVFRPKGTGANLAQIPDGTTAGGNKRGQYATDFQKSRVSAGQVSSGNYSVIAGGQSNSATGIWSSVVGGYGNAALGDYSIAGGYTNFAYQDSSIAVGSFCQVHLVGGLGLASGLYVNNMPFAPTMNTCQSTRAIFKSATNTADPAYLTTGAEFSYVFDKTVITTETSRSYLLKAKVLARQVGGSAGTIGDTAGWDLNCVLSSNTIIGSIDKSVIAKSTGASGWDVTVEGLSLPMGNVFVIKVTGETNKEIYWMASAEILEIG